MEALEERRLLLEELISARQASESGGLDYDLASIMAVQQEAHETINTLEAENSSLRLAIQANSCDNSQTDFGII